MDPTKYQFTVSYSNETQDYYEAYQAINKSYTLNPYLNPYYGYRFEMMKLSTSDNEDYRVYFTNGAIYLPV